MNVSTYLYKNYTLEKSKHSGDCDKQKCQLVIGFGGKHVLADGTTYEILRKEFPRATISLCSTAGEIYNSEVLDDSLSVTAIEFEKTTVQSSCVNINSYGSSFEAAVGLIKNLDQHGLKYIFIVSDGSKVNGSELVRGIESVIHHSIPVTGGLAGDGAAFKSTLVGLNEIPTSGNITAIGLYGDSIKIGHGSMGGWEMFGLEKKVTKAVANELFEIDHQCALDIYKQYLGNYSNELPGSALLFPLSIKLENNDESVVRTILSINNDTKSMVFAGDVPEGSKVRFMKANFDKLIDAASDAAENSLMHIKSHKPKLAILISCVGRKIILNKRVEEEVEAVVDILGKEVITTGFYSYGEISPLKPNTKCELHNQTMTITTFDEI
ncbi:MAG: FIST C-terminal domain-containing protein [Bacteroidetes bacterium]|nr:FIST C-terminal domain-containing protein [Bacteroidota bacterium]